MAQYRTSPLADEAPNAPETISPWKGHTMGGRVPAFMALASRTGGVYYENPPTLAEGLKGTDLDFEVKLDRVQASVTQTGIDAEGNEVQITTPVDAPRFRAAVAHYNDGRTPVVFSTWQSPRYTPIQTVDALALGEDLPDAKLLALGAYGDPVGCKVYAAYDLGGFTVGGKDEHGLSLTITTAHDGTGSLTARAVPVRFACTNEGSLYFGRGSIAPSIKIRHIGDSKWNAEEALRVLGVARQYAAQYTANMEALLKVRHSENDFIAWTRELWDVKDAPKGAGQVREDALVELLNGDTTDFGRGRAYASLNAVTEYLQHVSPVRGADPVAARANRMVLGRLDAAQDLAANSLLALV